MRRRASGIERITDALFSPAALAPLRVSGAEASGQRSSMIFRQIIANPVLALRQPGPAWIFPGYPPSPAFRLLRERTVLYVHDLFLLTRKQDLNWAAQVYIAPCFRHAITRLRYFLVNSTATAHELAQRVSKDARVQLYRPRVQNVFGLAPVSAERRRTSGALVVGGLGTIEPRKNFIAAAEICRILSQFLQRPVEFHIIGRPGWGTDSAQLSRLPHVKLHGFLADDAARRVIESFDLFLCTSHDEGLGLPLLEMQHAGLPVVAPDQDVFREVLGDSGTYIAPTRPAEAACVIAALLAGPNWRADAAARAHANITRWNQHADADRSNVIEFLTRLSGESRCPR